MSNKRITIYDLAKSMGYSASYISKALNDHPTIKASVKEAVRKKAVELNYKHNLHAVNLRQGTSKTIGVIVPHINQRFFSEAIAGIEEVSAANNYSLIICQSHESYEKECKTVDMLIHQNVDCILISVSAETQSFDHLSNIRKHNIELIQFDRYMEKVESYKVVNDNRQAAFNVTKKLFEQGYKMVAFLGGPTHSAIFNERKGGFLAALKASKVSVPYNFIIDDCLSEEKTSEIVNELLKLKHPPDAFLTVSDHQSLSILKIAEARNIKVPDKLGLFGFANEAFSSLIRPSLSSVDQRSKEMGKRAAQMYFDKILHNSQPAKKYQEEVIKSKVIERDSSVRRKIQKIRSK